MEQPRGAHPGSHRSARVVTGAGVACGPSRGLAVLLEGEPANAPQRSQAWQDPCEGGPGQVTPSRTEGDWPGLQQPGQGGASPQEGMAESAQPVGALLESGCVPPAPAQPLSSSDEEIECPELEMVDSDSSDEDADCPELVGSDMEDSDDARSAIASSFLHSSRYFTGLRQALTQVVVPPEARQSQLSPAQSRAASGPPTVQLSYRDNEAAVQQGAGRVQGRREGEDVDSDDEVPDLIEPVEQDVRMHFDWPSLHLGPAPFPFTSQATATASRNFTALARQALSPRFLLPSVASSTTDRQRTAQRRERRRRTHRQQTGQSGGHEAQLMGTQLGRLLTSEEEGPRAVGPGVGPPPLIESDDEEGVPPLVDGDSEDEEPVPELLEAHESWEGEESGSEEGEEYADMPELLPGSAPSSEDEGDLGSPSRTARQRRGFPFPQGNARAMSDRLATAEDDLRGDNFRVHGVQLLRNTFLGYPPADFVADDQLADVLAMLSAQSSFPWPPPASREAVAALERVTLTAAEEDDCCAVCRSSYEASIEVLRMPCRHLFHADCLHPWLDVRNTCPLCRFQLPTDNAGTTTEGAPPLLLSLEA